MSPPAATRNEGPRSTARPRLARPQSSTTVPSAMNRATVILVALLLLAFVSGAAALVYEVVFFRSLGLVFGVASHDALSGAEVETQLTGVIDLAKVASQAWTAGAKVYWDNTAKRVTNVASGNTLVGVAVLAVGSGADEVVGRVRLNGSF